MSRDRAMVIGAVTALFGWIADVHHWTLAAMLGPFALGALWRGLRAGWAALRRGARRHRRGLVGSGLLLAAGVLFYGATALRITLNGSRSLPHTAYLMVAWPTPLWTGAYVAVLPPPTLRHRFDPRAVFVKRVAGLPGDLLGRSADGRAVCLAGTCYPLETTGAGAALEATATTLIPEGRFAAFGASADSLDSRYAAIGLFDRSDVQAVGWPVNLPRWTVMRDWIGGGS